MRRSWIVAGIIGILLSCSMLWIMQPWPPRTIEDALEETFAANGVEDCQVCLEQAVCVPSPELCLRVVGDVTVSGSEEIGRLSCASYWHDCTLTMADYNMHLAPVPDVPTPHPYLVQLESWQAQVGAWLRRMSCSSAWPKLPR